MKPWVHAIWIVVGITAPIAVTMQSTSKNGTRSAANYAKVEAEAAKQAQHADASAMTTRQVIEAFEKAIDEKKTLEAIETYFAPNFIDHDPNVKGDKASVIERLSALKWNKQMPSGQGPTRTIKNIVVEGEIGMVHHHLVREPGTKGIAAVDIFKVQNGKIVEHWDVLQPIPEDSPNIHGMF